MSMGTFLPLLLSSLLLNWMIHRGSLTHGTLQCLTPTRTTPPPLLYQSSTQSRTLLYIKPVTGSLLFHTTMVTFLFVVGGWDLSWGYFIDRNLYRPGRLQTHYTAKDNTDSDLPASNSWMLGYQMWPTIFTCTLLVFLHEITHRNRNSVSNL